MTVRLIMSGALVGQELAAEFGPLPPAFLPVGVQRLYELQMQALEGAGPVHLVLPETFAVPEHDAVRLAALGAEIVPAPEGLSLGEAVVYALNTIGAGDEPVHLLHGDTLIAAPPLHAHDVIVAGPRSTEYAWAEMETAPDGRVLALVNTPAGEDGHEGRPIAAGYFAFASGLDLLRALARRRGDFIAAINHYLADRPVRAAEADDWLDFGHLTTFFQSRMAVTTARAFNTVRIDGLTARKSSADTAKMRAEAHWLQAAPPAVQIYCARLLGFGLEQGRAFYDTEYEFLPVLSELFVYGAVGRKPWLRILASCEDLLRTLAATRGDICGDQALRTLAADKTLVRLEAFARDGETRITEPLSYEGRPCPSLLQIAERLVGAMDLTSGRIGCAMHGDLCFSNLLYDSRNRRIKAIDPRGSVDRTPSLWGDLRYDLAKLGHSIVGRYDQIVAGRCSLARHGSDYALAFAPVSCQPWLAEALKDLEVDGVGGLSQAVRAVSVSLFLSMLPLHADRPDRQQAFIANALRLWRELDA
ncbi:MAG TPA: hypothetical protein VJS38_09055 [Phenylobacterium sp.]|uniref:hypothetical protein n=1 Tax=Phenylobacterium sp. TaxID=1871053 RepID=UPI002B473C07|nr:hypothetical protein [Phenylobacterium sp.]HKR88311.1 hypothetical protein [Phenylobacterium sp.]